MANPKIAIIVSSTRPTRFADIPTAWIEAQAKARGDLDVEVVDLRDFPMPFFDEVASNAWAPTQDPTAQKWQKKVAEFDGYIFVVAEYNRSITGVLKNAVDWASRPTGKSSLAGKPVAVTGATKGVISTAVAQNHLKAILSALGAPLVGVPEAYIRVGDEFFDGDGGFANAGTREFLTGFLRQLHDLIGRWAPGAS